MALSTNPQTLPAIFKDAVDNSIEFTSDAQRAKWALFLSFYSTLQQKKENKSEAVAFAAAKLAERITSGETEFYGLDMTVMVRELGRLSLRLLDEEEKQPSEAA